MFGAGGGTSSYQEIEETDVIILWGSNARETHPIFFHHLLKGVHNGARLYTVDPRRTTSAQWADLWLGIDVGTDIALSNTMAREIIHAGLADMEFIERATTGFAEYAESVEEWTLERGGRETGVPADAIRELAHAYGRADRAEICWTLGITEHHTAVDNVFSLINLALLTGHVGKYGSGVNPLRGQNNVQGGGDMGAIPNKLPGFQDIERDEAARARFEEAWGATIQPRYGWHLTQMFEAMERGDLTALYVVGENPADSEADTQHTLELLTGLDHLVVQDILMTRTAELADVVFPASASWCESEGTVTNSERRVQRVRKALDPPGEARDDIQIMCQLARRLGPPGIRLRQLRGGMGRAALALAHAPGDELPAAGGARRHPVAVRERGRPGRALPARAAVGGAGARPAGAVHGRRARAAGGRAGRRLPDSPDDGAAARLLQHRRSERRLGLAAAPAGDPRPVAGGLRAAGRRRGRAGADQLPARQRSSRPSTSTPTCGPGWPS